MSAVGPSRSPLITQGQAVPRKTKDFAAFVDYSRRLLQQRCGWQRTLSKSSHGSALHLSSHFLATKKHKKLKK
jgi:hypothetical protein